MVLMSGAIRLSVSKNAFIKTSCGSISDSAESWKESIKLPSMNYSSVMQTRDVKCTMSKLA